MTKKNERRTPPARVCGDVLGVRTDREYHQQATDAQPVTRSSIHELPSVVYSLYYLADRFATQAHCTGEGKYASAAVHTLYAFRHAYAAYYALLGGAYDQEGQARQ